MPLKVFRLLSIIEGLSLLFLLFVAMPAKYQFNITGIVPIAGMTHGCLWLSYVVLSLAVSHQQKWSVGFWLAALGASVVPFACFVLDRKLKSMTVTH